MNDDELRQAKDVEFYASAVNAWLGTKIEKDKTLITLSSGAIGLLITLISTIGTANPCVLTAFIFAIISFIVSTISIILIFERNAEHLENIIKGRDNPDILLKWLDIIACCSFIAGISLSFVIGVAAGIDKYSQLNRGKDMVKQEQVHVEKSYDGVANLRPASGSQVSGSQSGTQAPAGNNSGGSAGTQSQSPGNTSSANSQKKD